MPWASTRLTGVTGFGVFGATRLSSTTRTDVASSVEASIGRVNGALVGAVVENPSSRLTAEESGVPRSTVSAAVPVGAGMLIVPSVVPLNRRSVGYGRYGTPEGDRL